MVESADYYRVVKEEPDQEQPSTSAFHSRKASSRITSDTDNVTHSHKSSARPLQSHINTRITTASELPSNQIIEISSGSPSEDPDIDETDFQESSIPFATTAAQDAHQREDPQRGGEEPLPRTDEERLMLAKRLFYASDEDVMKEHAIEISDGVDAGFVSNNHYETDGGDDDVVFEEWDGFDEDLVTANRPQAGEDDEIMLFTHATSKPHGLDEDLIVTSHPEPDEDLIATSHPEPDEDLVATSHPESDEDDENYTPSHSEDEDGELMPQDTVC